MTVPTPIGPPPPVAAPLASSLRAPSRGDPPLKGGELARPLVTLGPYAFRRRRTASMAKHGVVENTKIVDALILSGEKLGIIRIIDEL